MASNVLAITSVLVLCINHSLSTVPPIGEVLTKPALQGAILKGSIAQKEKQNPYRITLLSGRPSVSLSRPFILGTRRDPIPGVSTNYPLYLSELPARNARWRALPVPSPDRTRYEMEGHPVPSGTRIEIESRNKMGNERRMRIEKMGPESEPEAGLE
ncbi:hypothetical protein EVAR_27041_1 [Eumeta japonica]|uniref:Uncharacterized protein n=1 Tax=Eumeta variegata TaxID=151549 RepID=A0A4C1WG20_EUMVA|nr:hypothetical protein EVAR_27041_1 [Eumeta japonica]